MVLIRGGAIVIGLLVWARTRASATRGLRYLGLSALAGVLVAMLTGSLPAPSEILPEDAEKLNAVGGMVLVLILLVALKLGRTWRVLAVLGLAALVFGLSKSEFLHQPENADVRVAFQDADQKNEQAFWRGYLALTHPDSAAARVRTYGQVSPEAF